MFYGDYVYRLMNPRSQLRWTLFVNDINLYRYCNGEAACYYVEEISASTYLSCDGDHGCWTAGDLSASYIYC